MKSVNSAVAAIIVTTFCLPGILYSQSFEPLTPISVYSCITLSNGDTHVGKVTPAGYDIESFDGVKKALNRNIAALDKKIDRYKDLLSALDDGQSVSKKGLIAAVNDIIKLLQEAADTNPKTRKEKISVLKRAIAANKTVRKGYSVQISALKDCQRHKSKHKPGFITAQIILFGGFVGAFLVGDSETYSTQNIYCVKGNNGIQGMKFQVLPCVGILPECSELDGTPKVGILLGSIAADHPFSDEEKSAYSMEVSEKYGGGYEVRIDTANEDYTSLLPCEDVFGEK